jgi:hypothetical protein
MKAMQIVALDIETETAPCHEPRMGCCERRGLDPTVTPLTVVSLHDENGHRILRAAGGGEEALLEALDAEMRLRTGLIVTWNGAAFDLPFLAHRYALFGIDNGLTLTADPLIPVKYQPLPGHDGAYRAAWYALDHADIQFAYREEAEHAGVPWSLKSLASALGLAPIEVDRTRMHELSGPELDAYAASDTRVTYNLAITIPDIDKYRDAVQGRS